MIKLIGCHLVSNDRELLFRFARKIGASKCWYSVNSQPHYELICPHLQERAENLLKRNYRNI